GRQFHLGARARPPARRASLLARQLRVLGEVADAAAVAPQEQPARRRPVPGEEGRLVDDGVAQTAAREDFARALAAPAGIEIVAMEIEHHDAGALHPFEQWIELGRVELPAVIEIIEA